MNAQGTKKKVLSLIIFIIISMVLSLLNFDFSDASLGSKDVKIKSKAAIVIDFNTGAILYEKNAHKKIYPASTTKILTAIVAIENSDMDDIITVSENALEGQKNNGTHVGLKAGEKLTMKDALYSMMLESANDSAIAIAEAIGGTEKGFAKMLNDKVKDLGLEDTHFVTPNGLFDKEHYTTPYDMAKIIDYAYKNEDFKKLYSTNKYVMSKTNKRSQTLDIYTTHRMSPGKSKYYKYAVAGKTGYVEESKCNLSTVAEKNGMTLIAYVATNSSPYDICDDTNALFEKCFKDYKNTVISKDGRDNSIKTLIEKGDYQIRNSKSTDEEITVTLPQNVSTDEVKLKLKNENKSFPIEKGDQTGVINAYYDGEVVGSTTLTASKDMTALVFYLMLALKFALYAIAILAVLLIIFLIYKKTKKNKKRATKGYSAYTVNHRDKGTSRPSQTSDKRNKNLHRK